MKQRPWPIILLALFHVIAPFGNTVINAWLANVHLSFYLRALLSPESRLTLLVFTVVPLVGAVLIYICKKWSYYLYIALMAIPFVYSLNSYMRTATIAMAVALILFYVVNILVIGYFLLPATRRLYFDPRMRWWETKPRYITDFQCQLEYQGQQLWAEIKNISEGGAFLETPSEFPENAEIKVFFKDAHGILPLDGFVVYRRPVAPTGYGFKFHKESMREPRLKELIKKLASEGAIIQGRMPGPEDTFVGWFKSLFPSRK